MDSSLSNIYVSFKWFLAHFEQIRREFLYFRVKALLHVDL